MVRYVEVAPSPDLSEWVDCYWSITGRIDTAVRGNRVLPDGCMDVILRFGDPPMNRDGAAQFESFVVGAMTSPTVVWQVGRVDLMGVRFRPGGAPLFLSVAPASEFTNAVVPLNALRLDADELYDRTASCVSQAQGVETHDVRSVGLGEREYLRARASVVESILRRRMRREASADAAVAAAVSLIASHDGRIQVRAIEERLGITQRSLERRFRSRIGLSPKVAARIARFQRAAASLQEKPHTSLARLAAERGYHDQAHMTREFREFAGLPPAAYAMERTVGFVQDAP
jgi:methylphosphotriester-DNA--protein-cysteine methyltransferase